MVIIWNIIGMFCWYIMFVMDDEISLVLEFIWYFEYFWVIGGLSMFWIKLNDFGVFWNIKKIVVEENKLRFKFWIWCWLILFIDVDINC